MKRFVVVAIVAVIFLACGPSWPRSIDIHISSDGGMSSDGGVDQ